MSIKKGKTSRIPVRICNMSAQQIKVSQNSVICKLSSVKVVDAFDPQVVSHARGWFVQVRSKNQ